MARPRKNIINHELPEENKAEIDAPGLPGASELPSDIPPENEAPVKKQRKPRESKPRATKVEKNILADQLEAAHKIAALVTGVKELELGGSECEALALAITDVMVYHDIIVNPKTAAYINLLSVAGMVYLPRGYAIYTRRKLDKINEKTPPQDVEKPHEEQHFEVQVEGDKIQPVPNASFDIADELLNYDSDLETFD